MAPNVDQTVLVDDDIPFYDVVIIGAGISGIGAAATLTKDTNKKFLVLERRHQYGGTWDLFKYPGIRSDSSMRTFCYSFHQWDKAKIFADAPEIKSYLGEVIVKYDLKKHIKYDQFVQKLSFDSSTSTWTVETDSTKYKCNFIFCGTGYYDYDKGYQPDFPGISDFEGSFVHPQFWPENLDLKEKKVIIIGSGATAVTIAPNICDDTKECVLLQRSPTYMISSPRSDKFAEWLITVLPSFIKMAWICYIIGCFEAVMVQILYLVCKVFPSFARKILLHLVEKQLPDKMEHFNPRYNPWDQRLCVVPDSDLFNGVKSGKIEMVTDTIKRIVKDGIELDSGRKIYADIIVSATGLNMKLAGHAKVFVDDVEVNWAETTSYRGSMMTNVPNFIYAFGYTNNSWTLKVDLIYTMFKKILKHMDSHNYKKVIINEPNEITASSTLELTSNYIKRFVKHLPKRGLHYPWNYETYYSRDWWYVFRMVVEEDQYLKFSR